MQTLLQIRHLLPRHLREKTLVLIVYFILFRYKWTRDAVSYVHRTLLCKMKRRIPVRGGYKELYN